MRAAASADVSCSKTQKIRLMSERFDRRSYTLVLWDQYKQSTLRNVQPQYTALCVCT
jgi:hypothetical protein